MSGVGMSGPGVDSSDSNLQRDSQLSAMFDGELASAECELMARRLTRDARLRDQWSRFALIGAALRADRNIHLDDRVAQRVSAALAGEPVLVEPTAVATGSTHIAAAMSSGVPSTSAVVVEPRGNRPRGNQRWLRPVAGIGIAASVAAASILLLRTEVPVQPAESLAAVVQDVPAVLAVSESRAPESRDLGLRDNGEPPSYVTPQVSINPAAALVPSAQLANYVVAHSEVSGPLSRRIVLSGLVASDGNISTATTEDGDAIR